MAVDADKPRVGVLALQGSFAEHCTCLARVGVEPVQVRSPEQLPGLTGLIIPGGESTTMALVAERWGLIAPLKEFIASGRPVWGTCAGLIFLADRAIGQKEGGQALLGGLDCTVSRNFFGSQIDSFETELPAPAALGAPEGRPAPDAGGALPPFRAVFIRAPAILQVGPGVQVLAEYQVPADKVAAGAPATVAVAVRGGPGGRLLATAFHPEVTADMRWHRLFANMCAAATSAAAPSKAAPSAAERDLIPLPPLPVYDTGTVLKYDIV